MSARVGRRAEPGALEPAAELSLLAGVAQARERQAEAARSVAVEVTADRLRTADRHDGDALAREVAAVTLGERLERDAVADALDEDDGARVGVGGKCVSRGSQARIFAATTGTMPACASSPPRSQS